MNRTLYTWKITTVAIWTMRTFFLMYQQQQIAEHILRFMFGIAFFIQHRLRDLSYAMDIDCLLNNRCTWWNKKYTNIKDAFLETAYKRSKIREVIFMDNLIKILKENNNTSFPDDSIIDWDEPVDYYNYFSNLKCYTEMLQNEMDVYESIKEFSSELVTEDMLECTSTWKNIYINSQVRQSKGVPGDIIEIDEDGKGDLHLDVIGSKNYIRFRFEIPISDPVEKLDKIDNVISSINEVVDFGTIYHTPGVLVYSGKIHYNYKLDLKAVKYYICDILNEVNAIHGFERDIQRELS